MPTERAIIRRLRSLGGAGCAPMPYDPQVEMDRRRFYLAEELLKIRAEDSSKNLSTAATEALAAAEIIYPELPPETGEEAANA